MYLIDKKLAQTVLNYLGAQPYVRVFNMVKAMENMPDYDEILKAQQELERQRDVPPAKDHPEGEE